ncbi:Tex family protein [Prevotella intermedia]|uniref:RNA-binding transcriptional accessory protein n=1 Tax=Prevotella intermedia TaxID=28131 RepID=A0A2D3LKH7_PREIN|nr:Tex family protein [Prevotella intermedia]ATV31088.1 RNA-binding transcriptional accessory protein [Prevotella intermedia]PJI22663.1 RNA-binding transcriptional accessory protein [Prevotella intermedia]
MNAYTKHIAQTLNLSEKNVDATLTLLNDGCTIPFIARYRKERTGNLDEVQITRIAEMNDRLTETDKRKETILKTISEQGKLTEELENKIVNCWDNSVLEDLYLPFKPKRRTKAQIAREQGLEPLATLLLMQREQNPMAASRRFVKGDVQDEEAALQGAKDIIAEMVSEDQQARNTVRNAYKREAMISSKVIKKVEDTDEAQKFSDYFDFFEPLRRCNSHRLLAMRRGEAAGILRVSISIDGEECIDRLNRQFVHGRGACQTLVAEAVEDSFKRLINPSIENEFAGLSKERADEEAIKVFTENLRQLLLSAPLGQKRVLALDPGFANGCKIACLDAQGNLLHHEIIYPHPPKRLYAQATVAVLRMIRQYNIEAIAIGNGTASRESKDFITDCLSHLAEEGKETPKVFVVSEDGASIYSASLTAREEFPDEDVTTRGAVSIGRRLMDPLAELVKIDPKNIGVGQYQHDVDQAKLRRSLDQTVESCVNQVGVNLNTASKHLLMYVSGLGSALAQNIVDYRKEHGAFTSRAQLKKVPRLGAVAFQQCAGFLRIPNAKNPLDNSAVHPESYHIVEAMAEEQNCSVSELISNKELIKRIDLNCYISDEVGLLTLNDILQELEKPGRDPREQLEEFEFDTSVHSIDDLKEGMELPGIVTNITNFGAFVDIGVHQDGLVHISQLSNKFVSYPNSVVHLHQHVRVRVTQIDYKRNRIGLSMKNIKQ